MYNQFQNLRIYSFTTHSDITSTLIGRDRRDYSTDPEVGRLLLVCCRVTSVSGWRKTNRYHAKKEGSQQDNDLEHHNLTRVNVEILPIFSKRRFCLHFCQNDGRNRQVPSASSKRRDTAIGEKRNTKTHSHARTLEEI